MKKKGIIGLFTSGVVLAGLVAATAIPALAMVDTTTNDVVKVDSPDSVLIDYKSDLEIRVFNEKQGIYVENLEIADGQYITGWFDSHLIHKFNSNVETSINLAGSVTFDNNIMAVIIDDTYLDATDGIFGLNDVTYPDGIGFRGLESQDSQTVVDKTITVDLYSSTAPDQIRVLTKSVVAVDIDIKPGNDEEPNPINNNGHGVIPVAILGSADFDVNLINPETVQLEGMSIREPGKSGKLQAHIEDVNEDGFDDLVVQIKDEADMLTGDSATLTGELYDGMPIEGTDTICLVPDKA